MPNYMLKRGVIIGILVLFVGISVIPSLSGNIVKNSENLYNTDNEKSSSDIDWWPMFRHDPGNTGYSTSSAPNTNDVLWKKVTSNFIDLSSPVVVDYRLYIGTIFSLYNEKSYPMSTIKKQHIPEKPILLSNRRDLKSVSMQDYNGSFLCFDTVSGTKIWEYPVSGHIDASPAIANGRAYITSTYSDDEVYISKIHCINAETGVGIWQDTIDSLASSPIAADGKVYVLSMDNNDNITYLRCFNATTGDLLWKNSYPDEYISIYPPALNNERVYFASSYYWPFEGIVHCVDAENGDYIWNSSKVGASEFFSTVVSDGKVLVPAFDLNNEFGYVYCFNAVTGFQLWNFSLGYWCLSLYSLPAICNGSAYIVAFSLDYYDSTVYCVNVSTGSRIWEASLNKIVSSSPALADGKIYFVTEMGLLFCLNVTDGSPVWLYGLDDSVSSSPSIADNKLYIVTVFGTIYAFGPLGDPPTPPDIDGPSEGKVRTELCWTFHSDDVNGDMVKYLIDWGDGTTNETDFTQPCTPVEVCHTWKKMGTYVIKAMSVDEWGAESNWAEFRVEIPRSRATSYLCYHWFFEPFQILEKLLRLIRNL